MEQVPAWVWWTLGGGVLLYGAVMCLIIGYRIGVRETERRWTEAVTRKHDSEVI